LKKPVNGLQNSAKTIDKWHFKMLWLKKNDPVERIGRRKRLLGLLVNMGLKRLPFALHIFLVVDRC
jgi:hypothetical protein